MDPKIENLNTTTFYGRRFTRKQIEDIQTMVNRFPNLSLRELAHSVCECFNWLTPNGKNKIQTCLGALAEMEKLGLFTLPAKVKSKVRQGSKKIKLTPNTEPQLPVSGNLSELLPLMLQKATKKEEIALWNEFIERYHYLGYKRPMGPHFRYFIIDKTGRKLGCLLFSFATRTLPARDEWIGWSKSQQERNLSLVINNNRFLIFPWVNVSCLASKALSIVLKQLAQDWDNTHGYRPVLVETFVDPARYKGTCYQAANWKLIGKSKGLKSTKGTPGKSSKDIYVFALTKNFKQQLLMKQTMKKSQHKTQSKPNTRLTSPLDESFVVLWTRIVTLVSQVATDFDKKWQKRKRVLNTMILILFIFRLVFSKNSQGYGLTITELWDYCHLSNIQLPQAKPVAPSAFCNAREKLDELIFKELNAKIIKAYEHELALQYWKNHRLFAIDGTRVNLPKQLNKAGYSIQSGCYYPQGLASCLYLLKSNIPVDFDLASHNDERKLALTHFGALKQNDVVVYDRGYFSYIMLYKHIQHGVHGVFRLKKRVNVVIDDFINSNEIEKEVLIEISTSYQIHLRIDYPALEYRPLKLRLVKYVCKDVTYVLGTTLFDCQVYKIDELAELYFSRWGIEELYKVSKQLIDVEDFHGQTERKVKQELFAHFVIITLSRIFTNKIEEGLNGNTHTESKKTIKVNMKNCLLTVARQVERMFLQHEKFIKKTLGTITNALNNCLQCVRPDRAYPRKSQKPVKKWRQNDKKKKMVTTKASMA